VPLRSIQAINEVVGKISEVECLRGSAGNDVLDELAYVSGVRMSSSFATYMRVLPLANSAGSPRFSFDSESMREVMAAMNARPSTNVMRSKRYQNVSRARNNRCGVIYRC